MGNSASGPSGSANFLKNRIYFIAESGDRINIHIPCQSRRRYYLQGVEFEVRGNFIETESYCSLAGCPIVSNCRIGGYRRDILSVIIICLWLPRYIEVGLGRRMAFIISIS